MRLASCLRLAMSCWRRLLRIAELKILKGRVRVASVLSPCTTSSLSETGVIGEVFGAMLRSMFHA